MRSIWTLCEAAAEDVELDVEEMRIGAAIGRVGHKVCGRQQGDFSHAGVLPVVSLA